jgi:hypothetical protein
MPDVDERLVAPETRYEIEDGKVVYVSPSDPPHAIQHASLAAVLLAHGHADFKIAVDMLTRTSKISDMAPDASVFPAAPDPRTGGRQIEHLAFEVVSTETLAHAAKRAADFQRRGVRRVFAIDVSRRRVLEWSSDLEAWSMLESTATISDPCLEVGIPVQALADSTIADTSVARALRERRHPEFLAEREDGREDGRKQGREEGREKGREEGREEARLEGLKELILAVLSVRELTPNEDQRARILAETDVARLMRWRDMARSCSSIQTLLDAR